VHALGLGERDEAIALAHERGLRGAAIPQALLSTPTLEKPSTQPGIASLALAEAAEIIRVAGRRGYARLMDQALPPGRGPRPPLFSQRRLCRSRCLAAKRETSRSKPSRS
jgi:hypothetical protein